MARPKTVMVERALNMFLDDYDQKLLEKAERKLQHNTMKNDE